MIYDMACMSRQKSSLTFREFCEELSSNADARRILRLPSAVSDKKQGEQVLRKIFGIKASRSVDEVLSRRVYLDQLRSRERRRLRAAGLR
jgi:hypothetical protein